MKPTNPKDAIGSDKLPLHLWPVSATIYGSLGLLEGALKYGRSNFREMGVKASIYLDACLRHLADWWEGNDIDAESGAPNLAHALACLAILVEATEQGNLNDDRAYKGAYYRRMVKKYTPLVKVMKDRHAGKSPKHFTIGDNK